MSTWLWHVVVAVVVEVAVVQSHMLMPKCVWEQMGAWLNTQMSSVKALVVAVAVVVVREMMM